MSSMTPVTSAKFFRDFRSDLGSPKNRRDSGQRLFIEYDREMAGIGKHHWVPIEPKSIVALEVTGTCGRSQELPFANS